MTAAPAFTSPPDPPVNLPPVTERGDAAADEQKGVDNLIKAAMAGSVVLLVAVLASVIWENEDYADYLAMLAALLLGGPIVYGAAKAMWTGKCSHDHGDGDSCGHDHAHGDEAAGGSHMEELVALAILASFALGEYMECALVAFFMLIASLIEHRTAVGALRDIESLVRITPTRAMRLGEGGNEEEVAASQLKAGDVVVVRPGDNVPADGTIRAGESSINQANITGESLPVEKQPGDPAFAGTINQTGRLEIEVTKAGEDSTLGKVKGLILQASQTRTPVVRELSKYTAYYTPVVLMLAAILFVLTENPEAAISLLLVACPCALILCGPTAVVASLSAASRLGIYVKSVADLEVVRRTTAFVMDKTGTLTTGELAVTKMRPAEGIDPAELLRLAATAEKDSRHPVARAVVAMAKKASVEPAAVTRFAEEAGRGVSVSLEGGGEVLVGREAFLNDGGVDASGLDMSGSEGLSLLYVARDGQAVGWVGMADGLRPGAAEAIRRARRRGREAAGDDHRRPQEFRRAGGGSAGPHRLLRRGPAGRQADAGRAAQGRRPHRRGHRRRRERRPGARRRSRVDRDGRRGLRRGGGRRDDRADEQRAQPAALPGPALAEDGQRHPPEPRVHRGLHRLHAGVAGLRLADPAGRGDRPRDLLDRGDLQLRPPGAGGRGHGSGDPGAAGRGGAEEADRDRAGGSRWRGGGAGVKAAAGWASPGQRSACRGRRGGGSTERAPMKRRRRRNLVNSLIAFETYLVGGSLVISGIGCGVRWILGLPPSKLLLSIFTLAGL